ncbi:MAG: RagB/SusD family nutrient uptake outer membrane protein [Dysgonomonas sp.]|nr:RagB/SusD family nutrient uptake outer membrane protein [Dysgonomonas sp.]
MKKIIQYLIYALSICLLLSSCSDYLDSEKYFNDKMTLEKVFKSRDYSEQWLADVYFHTTNFNLEIATKQKVFTLFASDDMYYSDAGATIGDHYRALKNGDFQNYLFVEPTTFSWQNCYKGINKATIFINHIDMNENMSPEEILDYKAQARFARAYLYWTLVRRYGPVPLLGDEEPDQTASYDDLSVPRASYDECIEYIASEMVLAAKNLDSKPRDMRNIARPTPGAALAVRAKAYLYAASPLMNGNQDSYASRLLNHEGKRLLSDKYEDVKWAKAAAAAKDVIELKLYELYTAKVKTSNTEGYPATIKPFDDGNFFLKNWPDGYADIDPFESYRAVFNGELSAGTNPELIYTHGQNDAEWAVEHLVRHQMPLYARGNNCHGTTQKQVDAYYMLDGTDVPGKDKEIGRGDGSSRVSGFVTQDDVNNGRYKPLKAGVSLQYAKKEPRFYASISYNGSTWNFLSSTKPERRNKDIWYYRGYQDGRNNTVNWLITGIGIKKYVKPSDSFDEGGTISTKMPTDMRYADILLSYAEALNELESSYEIESWDGNTSYTIRRDVDEIKKGFQPIRIRAGIPDLKSNIYNSKDAFREALKRERQIEFFAEGHRYYDLRRWKDAEREESIPIYGCNTLMTEAKAELFHTPVAVTFLPTVFTERTYFWPIATAELKRNKRLTQNPGWEINN